MTEQPTTHPVAIRTAAHLATIRQHWAELLLAIETPPADVWPPRQLSHTLRSTDEEPLDVDDRAPLVLREHTAPLNLDALDAGVSIERALFDCCDTLAATVQRAPFGDPRRWNYRSPTDPGSRGHGLHWAALYIEGRVLDEDTTPEQYPGIRFDAAPFAPLPEHLLHEAARVAHQCAGRLLRTLRLDQRTTPVPDRPCPWCRGELTLHTGPDEAPTVTCSTGPSCTAPVPCTPEGRRVWEWHALPALVAALGATEQREQAPPVAA
ncbi:hypothetical protein EYS09_14355 [Streptomyces kasugaensis]|uniref:Uncharacterized protein n=1 Tax=Streptomyces kasugaensis TaxID=1946 RepID=A0A4V6MU28_STRKA|nr:hypothetical protein [Streptomyces kasugaensis]TBO59021.1 hypothetical protein EYS09_14355 [Streptomyces kasugaensis]